MSKSGQPIDPAAYSEEYFLTECDGYKEYLISEGTSLSQRLWTLWRFLHVSPGMRVLDIGCGRGEMIVQCGLNGISAVGVDYSPAGLGLAQRAITRIDDGDWDVWECPNLSLGNAKNLPFKHSAFDRVIMSDIVEHLYPDELRVVLAEVYRVLVPGGELLIHTMPNLWYYRYGYPLFRLVQRFQGVRLPADSRDRIEFSHVHVNEQTPRALRGTLRESPFSHWRVWLYDYRDYSRYGPMMKRSMRLLTGLPVIKQVFCDDIFALVRK